MEIRRCHFMDHVSDPVVFGSCRDCNPEPQDPAIYDPPVQHWETTLDDSCGDLG